MPAKPLPQAIFRTTIRHDTIAATGLGKLIQLLWRLRFLKVTCHLRKVAVGKRHTGRVMENHHGYQAWKRISTFSSRLTTLPKAAIRKGLLLNSTPCLCLRRISVSLDKKVRALSVENSLMLMKEARMPTSLSRAHNICFHRIELTFAGHFQRYKLEALGGAFSHFARAPLGLGYCRFLMFSRLAVMYWALHLCSLGLLRRYGAIKS